MTYNVHSSIKGTLLPVIGMLLLVLLGYFCMDYEITNTFFPMVLFLICTFGAIRLIKKQVLMVWSPMTWFLFACAIYYGFGPLIYIYGTYESIMCLNNFYYVGHDLLFRTNVLNAVSITIVCIAFELGLRTKRTINPFGKSQCSPNVLKKLTFYLGGIGYSAHAIIFGIKSSLGLNATVPGMLYSLSEFTKLTVVVLVYRYFSGNKKIFLLMVLASLLELYWALSGFMKNQILEVLIAIFLGYFLVRPSRKALAIAMVIMLVVYLSLIPFVTAGRSLFWKVEGSSAPNLLQVISIFGAAKELSDVRKEQNIQDWWLRLCQSPSQAFAMNAYDRGLPSRSFYDIPFVIIPRIIYPNKPSLDYTREFTKLIQGDQAENSNAPSYFGDAYWNFGWIGVGFIGLYLGFAYAILTKINLSELAIPDLRWLPIAFTSIIMGCSCEGFFVPGMIAAMPLMIGLWAIIRFRFTKVTFG